MTHHELWLDLRALIKLKLIKPTVDVGGPNGRATLRYAPTEKKLKEVRNGAQITPEPSHSSR